MVGFLYSFQNFLLEGSVFKGVGLDQKWIITAIIGLDLFSSYFLASTGVQKRLRTLRVDDE